MKIFVLKISPLPPQELTKISSSIVAVKLYLNETNTTFRLTNMSDWQKQFQHLPPNVLICTHAEGQTMAAVLLMAQLYSRRVHICHVATKQEIELIKVAKEKGIKVGGLRSMWNDSYSSFNTEMLFSSPSR